MNSTTGIQIKCYICAAIRIVILNMSCLGLDPEGFTYDCCLNIIWKTASTKTSWVCFQYPSSSCVPMHQMLTNTSISSYHILVKCHGQWLFGIFSAVLEEEILLGILCVSEIIIANICIAFAMLSRTYVIGTNHIPILQMELLSPKRSINYPKATQLTDDSHMLSGLPYSQAQAFS